MIEEYHFRISNESRHCFRLIAPDKYVRSASVKLQKKKIIIINDPSSAEIRSQHVSKAFNIIW